MWAWLLVRASAVGTLLLVAAHLVYPYAVSVQFLLLLSLTFHAALGVRVVLLDLGVGVRWQRPLFAGVLLVAAAVFLLVWWGRS
jgi:succinate dehydrogenase / fumarate reductase cytochrome b subunit